MSPPTPHSPPAEPDPALGEVVRQLREAQDLSRTELAELAGVDETTVTGIEEGTIDPPWTAVEALGRVLGVSVQSIAIEVLAEDPDTP